MAKEIRVLLVDDHQVVRDGLCSMLADESDIEVVSQSSGGEEVLLQIERHSPNIILMDIKMPRMDGIQLAALVKQKSPDCSIIMLTLYDEYLVKAMGAGARGYLLKDISREELINAIRQVYRGEVVIGRNVAKPKYQASRIAALTQDTSTPEKSDAFFEEVHLVIPPPSDANQVIRFIGSVESMLKTRIIQVAGSWDEGTAVSAVLPKAVRVEEIINSLKEISGIESVDETPGSCRIIPNLADKKVSPLADGSRSAKVLFINFKHGREKYS